MVTSNANDSLRIHSCFNEFYRYQQNMIITEGVKCLADSFQCYWLLDVVCSYQYKLVDEPFQVWIVTRNEESTSCVVRCTDGNDNVLCEQNIPFQDFKPQKATVWV